MLSQANPLGQQLEVSYGVTERQIDFFYGYILGNVTALTIATDLNPATPTLGLFPDVLFGILVKTTQNSPNNDTYAVYRIVNGVVQGTPMNVPLYQNDVRFEIHLDFPPEYPASTDLASEYCVGRHVDASIRFLAYAGGSASPFNSWTTQGWLDIDLFIEETDGTTPNLSYIAKEYFPSGSPYNPTPNDFAQYQLSQVWWQDAIYATEYAYDDFGGLNNPDASAVAVWTEMLETDPRRQYAVNLLVKSMKRDGLWSNGYRLYIFQGDDLQMCRFDWFDPTNSAKYFSEVGSAFTSHAGVTGASSGYIDTNLTLSDLPAGAKNSLSISVGVTGVADVVASLGVPCGVIDGSGDMTFIDFTETAGRVEAAINGNDPQQLYSLAGTRRSGVYIAQRTDSNSLRLFVDGSRIDASDGWATSTNLPDEPLYVCARNNVGVPEDYFQDTVTFLLVRPHMTDTQRTRLGRIMQTYLASIYPL
jgi:hypothetical protein